MPRKFNWMPKLVEQVRKLYWEEQKCPREIVAILKLKLTRGAIPLMFHRRGIPVRDWSEALCLRPKRVVREETKRKVSLSLKGRPSPFKNRHHTPAIREKLRLHLLKVQKHDHTRRLWQDPIFRDKMIRGMIKGLQKRPTSPEAKILEVINNYNLPFVYNGAKADVIIMGKCPDFVNIDGGKVLIEVFGDYWHTKRADKPEDTESGREELFAQLGFRTLVLWESHIKESSIEKLAQEIKAFCNSY